MQNISPWIHQLDRDREVITLSSDTKTDVAVVGAGIAGVSTAFFLLKNTDKNVVLIDRYKLAHGATGHNAGQIAGYFERPFREIVEEFGLEMACEGERMFADGWALIDEIYTEAGLDIHLARMPGYAGISTKEQVLAHLENAYLRRKGGIRQHPMEIDEDAKFLEEIPEKYHGLFALVPREDITLKLETFDPQYLAVMTSQKGVTNSALFCQEVVRFLLDKHGERFSLYEHTPIAKVVLKEDKVILDAIKHTVECEEVVLCTNGFDNFNIIAPSGLAINTGFHHSISGVVAFMTSYLEEHTGISSAISYFPKEEVGLTDNPGDPYFYVTRRPYEYEESVRHNLMSIGGPDFALESTAKYSRDLDFSETAKKQIGNFIKDTFDKPKDLSYAFMWHGVMGYTKNMLRMIGRDPDNGRLLYNLGCNGVGILASVFGGHKVAKIMAGEEFPPSIFDIPKRT